MGYRVSVAYGHPTDPKAFDKHYEEVHIPLVRRIPGLVRFTASHGQSLDGSAPAFYFLAVLDFDSKADLEAGMSSAAGVEAGADVADFATGGATLVAQEIVDVTSG